MDTNELKRIVLSLNSDQKKEIVKQLIELINEGRGCIFSPLGWACGFKAEFERGDMTQ